MAIIIICIYYEIGCQIGVAVSCTDIFTQSRIRIKHLLLIRSLPQNKDIRKILDDFNINQDLPPPSKRSYIRSPLTFFVPISWGFLLACLKNNYLPIIWCSRICRTAQTASNCATLLRSDFLAIVAISCLSSMNCLMKPAMEGALFDISGFFYRAARDVLWIFICLRNCRFFSVNVQPFPSKP